MSTEAELLDLLRDNPEAAAAVRRQLGHADPTGAPAKASKPRGMNKWESQWAAVLTARGEQWEYEALKLRIGPNGGRCWFTVDFLTTTRHGDRLVVYEVKGFMRDDARVKLLAAVREYPQFCFRLVTKRRGEWVETTLRNDIQP